MKNRELIVPLYLKDGKVFPKHTVDSAAQMTDYDAAQTASYFENSGADALIIFDLSDGDAEHDRSISIIKNITRSVDIPVYGGGNIRRLEDVKKLIYAGCRKIFLNYAKEGNRDLTGEASARFGKDRMLACIKTESELAAAKEQKALLNGVILLDFNMQSEGEGVFLKELEDIYFLMENDGSKDISPEELAPIFENENVTGIFSPAFWKKDFPFMDIKHDLKKRGIEVNTYEAALNWEDFKTGPDGLLPVVVQECSSQEVLMVAYMNEEAYLATVRTGRMTYWSRSRKELWVKGQTSGHFQYVRELVADCDSDTLLAKVVQIGPACHTGSHSCFYTPILQKDYDRANPLRVFEDVFSVIEDRRIHPKEGSYTNYLFDKGIDKILKKIGEESSEIIIAAKNPDPEELIYEISDFLYHVMVLMSERGLSWEDITLELAKR